MKIDGTKSSSDVSKNKKTGKAASTGGAFKSMMADGDQGTGGVSGASASTSIASVDALLMAQATEDPAQKKSQKRMRERAESLLDKLNDLKMSMLTGEITVGHMISISDVAASHREKITDPELSALLDEVDLRAQIELAKLQMSYDKTA